MGLAGNALSEHKRDTVAGKGGRRRLQATRSGAGFPPVLAVPLEAHNGEICAALALGT